MFYFEIPAVESVLPVDFSAESTEASFFEASIYEIQVGDVPPK